MADMRYADICREAAGEFDHAFKYENGGANAVRLATHLRSLADLLSGVTVNDAERLLINAAFDDENTRIAEVLKTLVSSLSDS